MPCVVDRYPKRDDNIGFTYVKAYSLSNETSDLKLFTDTLVQFNGREENILFFSYHINIKNLKGDFQNKIKLFNRYI